jgi:hypothetical protein
VGSGDEQLGGDGQSCAGLLEQGGRQRADLVVQVAFKFGGVLVQGQNASQVLRIASIRACPTGFAGCRRAWRRSGGLGPVEAP